MLRTIFAAAPLVMLAACYSLDDIREGPVVWSATYEGQFDTLANCLSGLYGREYSVVPQLYQREQRANIVLAMPQGVAIAGEFQIRQIDEGHAEVSWKHIGSGAGAARPVDRLSRERADRCGRAA